MIFFFFCFFSLHNIFLISLISLKNPDFLSTTGNLLDSFFLDLYEGVTDEFWYTHTCLGGF